MKTSRSIAAVIVFTVVAASHASDFRTLSDRMQEIAAQSDLRISAAAPTAVAPIGEPRLVKVAAPAGDRLSRLNAFIGQQLSAFNDAQTSTRLAITHLSMNATRVLWAAFDLDVSKKGPKNEISIAAHDFEYTFPEDWGEKPTFKGTLTGKTDILKFMSQTQLNVTAPLFDRIVKELASSYLSDYGDAVSLDVKITDIRKDSRGNVTGLSFDLNSSIDPTKLPSGADPRSAIVTKLQAKVRADVQTGIQVEFSGECNPNAKAFEPGQEGLKEIVDKILNRDPQSLAQISGYLKSLNDLAKLITG